MLILCMKIINLFAKRGQRENVSESACCSGLPLNKRFR